jgi:response regulator RpfG family c-di-GMP phosphodiesterase
MTQQVIITVNRDSNESERIFNALEPFQTLFRIFQSKTAMEAEEELCNLVENEESLALVISDESLPIDSGVSFLMKLDQDSMTRRAHKLLIMHEPNFETLVRAINQGKLDYCLVPPWKKEELTSTVRQELTDFVIDYAPEKLKYASILDQERILGQMHEGGLTSWDHHR